MKGLQITFRGEMIFFPYFFDLKHIKALNFNCHYMIEVVYTDKKQFECTGNGIDGLGNILKFNKNEIKFKKIK